MAYEFDPVKEEKDGAIARRAIWSTASFDKAIQGLNEGRKLAANPFFMNNIKLSKADLVYKRTDAEIAEFRHCMQDINYFANNYCKLMTPEGVKNIQLRDYQEKYLTHVQKNRLSIYLSCRQAGKCVNFLTKIKLKLVENSQNNNFTDDGLINRLKHYYNIKDDTYEVPLYELYNLYDNSALWKTKYMCYQRLNEAGKDTSNTEQIIAVFDKLEPDNQKLIHSFDVSGIEIETDTGYKPVSQIHMTKAFDVWTLKLSNSMSLECADTHIVFDGDMNGVFVEDLHVGDFIQTKEGLASVVSISKSDTKMCMCDITVDDDNHRFYSNGILSHNTTTSAIFMLWYILFNVDKNALVLGNKRKTAIEILDKLKSIFLELPFFLKPGIRKWNEGELAFDNGCRIMAEATTPKSGIGFTFHCVLADEFAHIAPNILDTFYNNLFPVVTAGRARFMITSTQNGHNLMERLYNGAINGENEYAPFKTDWDEVPEWDEETHSWVPRDEKWYKLQVANYGSEEAFNAQFGTQFFTNAKTLINTSIIRRDSKVAVKFVQRLDDLLYSENWYFNPEYDLSKLRSRYYVITCDISEGTGNDYTIFDLNEVTLQDGQPIFECVGYYESATATIDENINALASFCNVNLMNGRYIISLEYNLYGELFYRLLMEKLNITGSIGNFDETVFVKYKSPTSEKLLPGIKITAKSKPLYCTRYKQDYEMGRIKNKAMKYYVEMQNFADKKENGSYEAMGGHDDLMMAQVQLAAVKDSTTFKYFIDDMSEINEEATFNTYDFINSNLNFNPLFDRSLNVI